MVWNNLEEAAVWLSEATKTKWSVKQVLDAALTNYEMKVKELYRPNPIRSRLFVGLKHRNAHTTCLEAVMPRGTEFGHYEIDTAEVTPVNPTGWVRKFSGARNNVELTQVDVKQLLLYGEVRVGMAKHPDPEFGTGKKCVLIEPVDKEHIVTLDMVGISREELKMLASEFDANLQREQRKTRSNDVANQDRWEDKAKAIAQEVGLKKYRGGERQISAHNVSEETSIRLAEDPSTHGKQGPRSADNVRTQGLKGWKFVPPKEGK
jgi:hypothetical protein